MRLPHMKQLSSLRQVEANALKKMKALFAA